MEQKRDFEGRGARFKKPRRKVCHGCGDKLDNINYKDLALLRKFISERGKILPKRMTGACSKHQRNITIAIKRARHLALLPYIGE